MTNKTTKRRASQPLRRTIYVPRSVTFNKSISHKTFRIFAALLAHKPSCEPTPTEAAKLVGVGDRARISGVRRLMALSILTQEGRVANKYRVVREDYSRVNPATIMRADLSDVGLRFLVALSGFADKTGFAFPKVSTLSTKIGVSRRTGCTAMSELQRLGLIAQQPRRQKSSWKWVLDEERFPGVDPIDLPATITEKPDALPAQLAEGVTAAKFKYAASVTLARRSLFLTLSTEDYRRKIKSGRASQSKLLAPLATSPSPLRTALFNPGTTAAVLEESPRVALRGSVKGEKTPRVVSTHRASERMARAVVSRFSPVVPLTSWERITLRAIAEGACKPPVQKILIPISQSPRLVEIYSVTLGGMQNSMRNPRSSKSFFGLEPTRPGKSVDAQDYVQPQPEISLDDADNLLYELHSEMKKRHGEGISILLPRMITTKERAQLKKVLQVRYTPEQITRMIKVLVWDWEEVRVATWPKLGSQPLPDLNALILFHAFLVQHILSGVPSVDPARRGRVGYASRYVDPVSGQTPPGCVHPPQGLDLEDLD